jgi:glyceraldehyde 3-phosphate dehydrogenase
MRATVVGFAGLVATASAFAPTSVLPKAATRTHSVAANAQMGVKSGINGFGRIGRQVARIMIESNDCDLLQINAGSATPDYMAYQYKFDSIHGRVGHEVVIEGDDLILKGKRVKTTREREPGSIGWSKNKVEYLCESTGVFLTEEKAKAHVDAGVKKVIFSAPRQG